MEVPKDHITTLLDNDLFYSAQMLGCFLVSSAVTNSEASPYLKAENLVRAYFYRITWFSKVMLYLGRKNFVEP
ncbi:hypothetical protein BHE74_00007898 [Ensete ventricosum]|nr:hypothetical protein BHE74_00007898 [Ensete ventricosum]